MPSDEVLTQLVHRAAGGDAAAMECLLVRYNEALLRYIERRLPSDLSRVMDAQDILQDVHFEVFRRLSEFTSPDIRSVRRWLVCIARNRLIDAMRMHYAAKRHIGKVMNWDGDDGDRPMVGLLQELAVYERTPSRSALAHELINAMQQAMGRLPADHRQALQHRYMEGLSVEDSAVRMGRTEGALRMLCNRGLAQLRSELRAMSFCY